MCDDDHDDLGLIAVVWYRARYTKGRVITTFPSPYIYTSLPFFSFNNFVA